MWRAGTSAFMRDLELSEQKLTISSAYYRISTGSLQVNNVVGRRLCVSGRRLCVGDTNGTVGVYAWISAVSPANDNGIRLLSARYVRR